MSEERLDLLSYSTGDSIGLGLCDHARLVASSFMNRSRDLSRGHVRTAAVPSERQSSSRRSACASSAQAQSKSDPSRCSTAQDAPSARSDRRNGRSCAASDYPEHDARAEALKQRLRHHPPLAHQRPNLLRPGEGNQRPAPFSSGVFQHNPRSPSVPAQDQEGRLGVDIAGSPGHPRVSARLPSVRGCPCP